jgi:hypothetical protein
MNDTTTRPEARHDTAVCACVPCTQYRARPRLVLHQPVLIPAGLSPDGGEALIPGIFLGVHSVNDRRADPDVDVRVGPPGRAEGRTWTARRSRVQPLYTEGLYTAPAAHVVLSHAPFTTTQADQAMAAPAQLLQSIAERLQLSGDYCGCDFEVLDAGGAPVPFAGIAEHITVLRHIASVTVTTGDAEYNLTLTRRAEPR